MSAPEVRLRPADAAADERLLLALLNSTPVVDGVATDELAELGSAPSWLAEAGAVGGEAELTHLRRVRATLQEIVRGEAPVSALDRWLRGVTAVPQAAEEISWALKLVPERTLAIRAILAFDTVSRQSPGRLRPCANDECRLFLIDHSTANRARWCSMAICGNRMKARRHYRRTRQAEPGEER